VNDNDIENVNYFNVPEEITGIMKIKDLKMSIEQNFFSFSMDPEYIISDIGSDYDSNTNIYSKDSSSQF
jgi:hypothetical protein